MFNNILLTTMLFAVPISMSAANDEEPSSRRWAVIAGMNLSCPTTAVNEQSGQYVDKAASFGSAEGNVMVEYYLRNPHFSVVGGYNAETMEWYGSDVDVTMHNIALGARYYPLSSACVIQPYAALMTYTNVRLPVSHRRQDQCQHHIRRTADRIPHAFRHAPPQHTDRREGNLPPTLHHRRRQQPLPHDLYGTRHIRP